MRIFTSTFLASLFLTNFIMMPSIASAQEQLQPAVESSKVVGPYEILYSVVPTTFIAESVASSYQIVRGKDQAMINVSIRKKAGAGDVAQAAVVTGTYSDLMQSKKLAFKEIREQDAIYYIATFRHEDKDLLRFELKVQIDPQTPIQTITFTRKLYVDE
jgi:hypothetical protein